MHISQIILRDWKAYTTASFDFPAPTPDKNIVLIGAPNGYGKTSLFEAIVLGMFGRDGLTLIWSRWPQRPFVVISALDDEVHLRIELVVRRSRHSFRWVYWLGRGPEPADFAFVVHENSNTPAVFTGLFVFPVLGAIERCVEVDLQEMQTPVDCLLALLVRAPPPTAAPLRIHERNRTGVERPRVRALWSPRIVTSAVAIVVELEVSGRCFAGFIGRRRAGREHRQRGDEYSCSHESSCVAHRGPQGQDTQSRGSVTAVTGWVKAGDHGPKQARDGGPWLPRNGSEGQLRPSSSSWLS